MKYPEQESSTIEWKGTLPKHDQILKTVIGFCNRNGGKIIIGVDDQGTIIGVDEDSAQEWLEYLDKMVYEASAPPIIPMIHLQRTGDKTLLIIEVSAGMNKPYYIKSEGLQNGTYIRLGRSTLRANADMIEELKWASRGLSFDRMPVYQAQEADLDMGRILECLVSSQKTEKPEATKELLLSYHLITEQHATTYPTTAGILLFGKEPQRYFPEASIICSHFTGVEGRKAIASVDCTGTLFQQFSTAWEFLTSRLYKAFSIKGPRRTETLEIPEEALREVLLNALIHRNYHILAPTKIALYTDRIEVFSPGDFPGPITQATLRLGLTYLRNPALCKVFRKAGYIEKLGTGFTTLFTSYEERGLRQPQVLERDNCIKCILPRQPAAPLAATDAMRATIIALFDLSSRITIADVMDALHIPRATAGRRLSAMTKEGLLNKIAAGRSSYYTLNRA